MASHTPCRPKQGVLTLRTSGVHINRDIGDESADVDIATTESLPSAELGRWHLSPHIPPHVPVAYHQLVLLQLQPRRLCCPRLPRRSPNQRRTSRRSLSQSSTSSSNCLLNFLMAKRIGCSWSWRARSFTLQ